MATARVTITGLDSLQRLALAVQPEALARVAAAGARYAARSVPPAVSQSVRRTYSLPAARIKADIGAPRIQGEGAGLEVTIPFSRRPPTLTQFQPRPGRRGPQRGLGRGRGWAASQPPGRPLTAAVIRGERKPVRGAFLATGRNGNRLILQRRAGRLVSLYGPSTGSLALGNSREGQRIKAEVERRIQQQFEAGVQRELNRQARGFGG